jgi:hypothetical protein
MTIAGLDAPIRARDIDSIIEFLPRLQSLDPNQAARWPEIRRTGEKEFEIYRGEDHPLVTEFIKALYQHGLVRDFDWPKWQPEAMRLYDHPEALKKARMKTCVKLLTLHARKDRFVDRHFASMVQSGHIAAVLSRMAEIRRKWRNELSVDSDQS